MASTATTTCAHAATCRRCTAGRTCAAESTWTAIAAATTDGANATCAVGRTHAAASRAAEVVANFNGAWLTDWSSDASAATIAEVGARTAADTSVVAATAVHTARVVVATNTAVVATVVAAAVATIVVVIVAIVRVDTNVATVIVVIATMVVAIVVHNATSTISTTIVVLEVVATVVATYVSTITIVVVVVAPESVADSASVRTKSVTWANVSTCWTHTCEEVTSVIVCVVTRNTEVEASRARVVVIDSEPPSCILEEDWTVEVVVSDEASPLVWSEEQADGSVACSKDCHVVIVVITVCDVIQIVVHCIDIVVVDHIEVVNESFRQTEGVSHAVGEETSVVTHCVITHWLCFNSYGCHNEKHCCE